MIPRYTFVIAAISVLAGCAGGRAGGPGDAARAPEAAVAQESAAILSAMKKVAETTNDYQVSPGDLIALTVYGDQDLSRKLRVSQNGTVSMPFVGEIHIGGRTLREAETVIRSKLAEFYVSPNVSLFIEEYGSKQVFVLGEVNKPGAYRIPAESGMTVLQAVTNAGGFTPIAGVDGTRILRNSNGRNEVVPIDITAITKKGEKERDLRLEPNDVVYVPQSVF